jgi:CheY-like chemotaxis protein
MPRPIHCILLIDDDPDDNYVHQIVIEESGLCDTVRVAEDGFMGLDYLKQVDKPDYVRPDVILLDINMPGMNGFEFLEQYRTLDESLRDRTILMMLTTSVVSSDRNRGGLFEAVKGFLTKPITEKMLQSIVENYFS